MDKQQIVDFRLHPWADQYLMLLLLNSTATMPA